MAKNSTLNKKEEPKPLPTDLTENEVLSLLGRPDDLLCVEVHRYDVSRCRVNIKRSMDKKAAEKYFIEQRIPKIDGERFLAQIDCTFTKRLVLITDSFYLRTNNDGSLRDDSERPTKKYKCS
jgi:hypothetical protein